MPREEITGFILAGGRSRRMGRDKSELPWAGKTFLLHSISRMQDVCDPVFLLGETTATTVPKLKDAFPGDGPLAGLHSALLHSTTDWNLVLAVDMPLVPVGLLKFLASHCDTSGWAVVPKIHIGKREPSHRSAGADRNDSAPTLQPLCAAYHKNFLPYVERALSNRELSVRRLLEELSQGIMGGQPDAIQVIDEQELISAGFSPELLMNVNTPADLDRARALADRFNVE